jgi:hypothetical protein
MGTGELEAFLLVAERGSLTLAARELGLSQPGLSRQMHKLEQRLGMSLFVRTLSAGPASRTWPGATTWDVALRSHARWRLPDACR